MNLEESFLEKITTLQTEYYTSSKKKLFFKSKQKDECANVITNKIGIEDMLNNSIFIIPDTNRVFFDYAVFKLYATPEVYDLIINHILQLFDYCIKNYRAFESHINLNSFSISAMNKYKPIILKFCNECLNNETKYTQNLTKLYIYNTPNMIDMATAMVRPFINENMLNKVIFIKKQDSEKLISELTVNSFQIQTT